ncbi:hypothetical protein [uncultured Bacteroides sp.]|uniref:hypothetical protein n=1 Tax=uncultured Bacteroides sp. TaxID=162156 RepID=UPI0026356186|nr:hypothetical protein [uncultured Bacteroides sp.]
MGSTDTHLWGAQIRIYREHRYASVSLQIRICQLVDTHLSVGRYASVSLQIRICQFADTHLSVCRYVSVSW